MSPAFAKRWFWESCDAFSMSFSVLVNAEGEAFLKDCKRDGKAVFAWTVNSKEEMMEVRSVSTLAPDWIAHELPMQCVRMGVQVILTDHTRRWLDLRSQLTSMLPFLTCFVFVY